MNREYLFFMDANSLREHIINMEREASISGSWDGADESGLGKLFIDELEQLLEDTRRMYKLIPAHAVIAPIMLAGIQGKEQNLESILNKIKSMPNYKQMLDEDIKYAVNLLKVKESEEKKGRKASGSIVAARAGGVD